MISQRFRCFASVLLGLTIATVAQPVWSGDPAPVPPSVTPTLFSLNADYIVHMDLDPGSNHYYPLIKGLEDLYSMDENPTGIVGNPGGYHWGYTDLGFKAPYFSGDRNVYIYDCNEDDGDCDNGMARFSAIWMPAPNYDGRPEPCTRAVIGHELYHHVEYAYISPVFPTAGGCGGTWGKFVCEGQARAMQDKIYSDLDVNSALSCTAGFVSEVNNFLGDTTQAIWESSYRGSLFWTYLMEQYGSNALEPTYGADFLVEFWEQAEAQGQSVSASAAINDAIDAYGSDSLLNAFHSFILANYIKDLDITGTSQAFQDRYSYRDGNANEFDSVATFNSVFMTADDPDVINVTAPWWGARYDRFGMSACPTGGTVTLQVSPNQPGGEIGQALLVNADVFIGVVVERDNRVQHYYKKRAPNWTLQFTQPFNHYEQMTVVTGGIQANASITLTASCSSAPPEPQLPLVNPLNPQTPGPPDVFTFGEIEPVFPIPPDPVLPPLTAFDSSLFQVSVGGLPAQVLGGVPSGNGVKLQVQYPLQPAPGAYDLTVALGEDSMTVTDAIVFGDPAPDTLLLMDLSTTMGIPPDDSKLNVAQFASNLFVDSLPDAGQLGLISFAGDDMEPSDDAMVRSALGAIDDVQRNRMHVAIDALATGPGMFTSVGDGLRTALNELAMNGASSQARHLVMLLDGGENEAEFWSDVQQDIFNAGVTVHAIAFGGRADQGLAQEIARTTGGQYQYADDAAPEADCGALGRAYLSIADEIAGRRRFMDQTVSVGAAETITVGANQTESPTSSSGHLKVFICPSDDEIDLSVSFTLFKPNGTPVRDGVDGDRLFMGSNYIVAQVADFERGEWTLQLEGASALPEAVEVFLWGSEHNPARSNIGLAVLPEIEDEVIVRGTSDPRFPPLVETGQVLRIGTSLTNASGAVENASVFAQVIRPGDGSVHRFQIISANDEQEFFGRPNGVYSGVYRGVSQGSPTGIADDPMLTPERGSYDVQIIADSRGTGNRAGGGNTIAIESITIAHEATHVLQQTGGPPDRDNDGMPDPYEDRFACLNGDVDDSLEDGDQDTLPNATELDQGTHPCVADTDGGGEQDGSELRAQRNPLSAEDDALPGFGQMFVLKQGLEHEPLELFEPNALTIQYETAQSGVYFEVTVRKAIITGAATWSETTFNPRLHPGLYRDRGLTVGDEVCYQMYGVDAAGNESAPSQISCGIVRADPEPPLGHLEIGNSAKDTDDPIVIGRLYNYNKNPSTTEMSVSVDEHPDFAWIPYAETFDINTSALRGNQPRRLEVYAALRDVEGAVSEVYTDSIMLWPDGSLGTINGSVALAAGRGATSQGILITVLSPPGISPAQTDAAGDFVLDELPPGSYDLEVSFVGYLPQVVTGVIVTAGQTTDVGQITLLPESEILFVDGFE